MHGGARGLGGGTRGAGRPHRRGGPQRRRLRIPSRGGRGPSAPAVPLGGAGAEAGLRQGAARGTGHGALELPRCRPASLCPSIPSSTRRRSGWCWFARWRWCRRSRAAGATPVFYLDEPGLYALDTTDPTHLAVLTELRLLVAALRQQGALVGLHCCGNTRWSALLDLGIDLLSFDVRLSLDAVLEDSRAVRRFLDRGGAFSLGLVPTDLGQEANPEELARAVETSFEAALPDRPEALRHFVATPACGLAMRTRARGRTDLRAAQGRPFRPAALTSALGPGTSGGQLALGLRPVLRVPARHVATLDPNLVRPPGDLLVGRKWSRRDGDAVKLGLPWGGNRGRATGWTWPGCGPRGAASLGGRLGLAASARRLTGLGGAGGPLRRRRHSCLPLCVFLLFFFARVRAVRPETDGPEFVQPHGKTRGMFRRRRGASSGGQGRSPHRVMACKVSAGDRDRTPDLRFASLFRWYGTTA